MFNSISAMYRLQFNNTVKDTYSNNELKEIITRYIDGIDSKSKYDNKERIIKYIDKYGINFKSIYNFISPKEVDLIDFIRYRAYYTELTDIEVAKSLIYKIDEDDEVTVNNVIYVWNRRKNYFTEVDRKISFIDAIKIIENKNSNNSVTIEDRELVFGFINDRVFLVVEISSKDKIRIISFRRSDEEEFNEYIRR